MLSNITAVEALEFIAQDLANERVETLEEALAIIRNNVSRLAPAH
jgi:hypothetical protein